MCLCVFICTPFAMCHPSILLSLSYITHDSLPIVVDARPGVQVKNNHKWASSSFFASLFMI